MGINFISVSPIGSVRSTQPLTHDEKFEDSLSEAGTYDDSDLWHFYVLNAVYRWLLQQDVLTPYTEIEQN